MSITAAHLHVTDAQKHLSCSGDCHGSNLDLRVIADGILAFQNLFAVNKHAHILQLSVHPSTELAKHAIPAF